MISTVSTKFNVPQLDPRLVIRPRILQRYSEGLLRRLILVAAPAGYGKTTSVAMWLRSLNEEPSPLSQAEPHAGVKTAWYALDADDDEYSTFYTRFVAALKRVMPGALPTVAVGLAIQGIQPLQYANTLAEACVELPYEVVLVLDDYHIITAPEIHTVLAQLIQYASSKLHLVIISRHDPPLPLSLLRARQQLAEVRVDDLRLTDTEAAALLKLRLVWAPSPELVSVLQARAEGWVAGLQLAAASVNQETEGEFLENFHRSESLHVVDFLVDEVLDRAPAQVREFLLKTSFVAHFNVDLAALVTQFDSAACAEILDYLRRANLFLVVLDGERALFRYHRQFRAMLMNRAGLVLPAEAIAAIRRSAGDWLVSHGWIDEALAQYVADAEWNRAADLVEADRHRLQNRQDWHLLWGRLRQLPDEVVVQRPGLLLAKAWILQVHGRYAAMALLGEQAATLLSSDTPHAAVVRPQVLWGEVEALRGAWFFADVPLERRLECIQEALLLLAPAQQYGWVRGFAFISLVHVMLGLGQRDAAYRQLMREFELADLGSGDYLARLYQAVAGLVYLDGSLRELGQTATRYLELAIRCNLPMASAWARYAIGWALYQQGESSPAFDALLPVFDRPREIHLQNLPLALAPLVTVAAELGRTDVAARLVELARQIGVERDNIATLDEVSAIAAHAALLAGDRQAALAWAADFVRAQADTMPGRVNLPFLSGKAFIGAKIMLAAGSGAQVGGMIQLLCVFLDAARRRGYLVEVVQAAVLLACCYWRTGQAVRALDWMQQAVASGMPRGFRRVYFEQGADVAEMLYAMVQRGMCAEAASALLAEYSTWSSARQAARPVNQPVLQDGITMLTEREEDILVLLAQRLTNKEIARRLNVSVFTVRNHASHIYEKLHVTSRKEAIALAKTLRLLPPV